MRRLLLAAAVVVGATAGSALALVHAGGGSVPAAQPSDANVSWPAGAKRAPDFRLADAGGAPISLARFRGRPVIVTFIDPACTTLCPLEAKVLEEVVARSAPSPRPAIVAVSVNPWAESRDVFAGDVREWRLTRDWHWAIGPRRRLAPVWKRYGVAVLDRKKLVGKIVVHEISHTEVAVLVDARGFERALYAYPFRPQDLERGLAHLGT
jgi:protein SCO1